MYPRYLLVFVVQLALVAAIIDCTEDDSCYGEPPGCDPDVNCDTLFQFDLDGNLNMFLNNFPNEFGYVSFSVERHPDNTIRRFFCLPHQGQRFGSIMDFDGSILLIDKNETGLVETIEDDYFRCFFNASELSKDFYPNKAFFVSKGIWSDFLVMESEETQLINIMYSMVYDDQYDDVIVTPMSFYLGYPVKKDQEYRSNDKKVEERVSMEQDNRPEDSDDMILIRLKNLKTTD